MKGRVRIIAFTSSGGGGKDAATDRAFRDNSFGSAEIMDRPERREAKGRANLSQALPIRARMRPALHKKAQSLARRIDLSPDCLVISFFELDDSGPMCWLQFTGDHDVRQTLAAPLADVALRTAHKPERSGRSGSRRP